MRRGIFISYRSIDHGYAGRVYDRISQYFDKNCIFFDTEKRGLEGEEIQKIVEKYMDESFLCIALVGPNWIAHPDENGKMKRMSDNPNDWVRKELEAAFHSDVKVIPILLPNATIPPSKDLSKSLSPLKKLSFSESTKNNFNTFLDNLLKKALIVYSGNDCKIQVKHSRKYLAVYFDKTSSGDPVIQYDYHEANNHKFRLKEAGEYWYICSRAGNLCLAVPDKNNSTKVIQLDLESQPNKDVCQFDIVPTENGYWNIKSKYSGLSLAVNNGIIDNDAPIVQFGGLPPVEWENHSFKFRFA